MFVCCECCVLSGRRLCDELITRPEESYRLWCDVVCDLETSRMSEESMNRVGSQRHRKKNLLILCLLNGITEPVLFPTTHTCHSLSKTADSNCNIHCCKYEYIVNILTNNTHQVKHNKTQIIKHSTVLFVNILNIRK
jgi:hypothetical protein